MLNEAFQTLKTNLELNATFAESIQTHHNAVRGMLQNADGTLDTKLIGSVGRKTRIQPRPADPFDIDVLIILGGFDHWLFSGGGITPDEAMRRTLGLIQQSERYAAMNPQPDHPTVTIPYQDHTKVEIVPAYRDNIGRWPDGRIVTPAGRGYWIPKQGRWELADYDYDSQLVSDVNRASDGWLIPTLKMLKALRRRYFSGMGSFHFEIICVRLIPPLLSTLRVQQVPVSFPLLIKRFFAAVPTSNIDATAFPGSNTPLVSLNGVGPQSIVSAWQQLSAYCNSISGSERQQCYQWREVFGEEFPAV